MSDVDDLFGGGAAPAPPDELRRVRSARLWTTAGWVLGILGPCCCTGVPGAAALVWGFYTADEETARGAVGAIDARAAEEAARVRRYAAAGMGLTLFLLLLQVAAWSIGAYEQIVVLLLQGGAPAAMP